MRYFAAIVFAMLFLTGVSNRSAKAADAPVATGTIVGTAVDAAGNPVSGCLVTAMADGEKFHVGITGSTEKDGKFKLEKAPEGDYNLNIRTPDGKLRALKSLSVLPGKTVDVGKLILKPIK